MALFGTPGVRFSCGEYACVLNDCFNIVLWTDNTMIVGNIAEPFGLIIPVEYLSFIKTINKAYEYSTDLSSIFTFDSKHDEQELKRYVSNQIENTKFRIIKDLAPPKKRIVKKKLKKWRGT